MSDLCKVVNRSYVNTKRMVNILEKRGFVKRVFAGQAHPVILTKAGEELIFELGGMV